MKNSDAIKAMLLAAINEIAADPKKYAVNPGRDFTRNRKMGFHDTLLMLLTLTLLYDSGCSGFRNFVISRLQMYFSERIPPCDCMAKVINIVPL